MADDSPAGGTPAAASASGAGGAAAGGPSTETLRAEAAAQQAEAIRRTVAAEHAAALKAATGYDSVEALAAARAAADAAALAEQGRYRELHEASAAELARTKAALDSIRVQAAVVAAARGSVDPEVVHALLNPQADIDAAGRVTIGGKDPATAVADLLKEKPWLAAPAGGQGSGAGAAGGTGAPSVQQMTMAQLDDLRTRDPVAYRAEIKRRAGGAR